MKKSFLIAGAAMIAVAVPAIAAPVANAPKGPHAMMEQDISRADVEAKVKEQFAMLDANKDGVVTKDEIRAAHNKQRAAMKDKMFAMLDKDGNGSISRAEFDAAGKDRGPRGAGKGGPMMADGAPDMPPPPAGKAGHGKKPMRMGAGPIGPGGGMLVMADANKDGKVTLAEATGAALSRFDKMDADKNGVLTAAERMEAMKQMRDQHKAGGKERPAPAA